MFGLSMWRTGSTFLASRFAVAGYQLFYEPCHEYVGSHRTIAVARMRQSERLAALRHPDVGGGYFDIYDQRDPVSQRSLSALYDHAMCLRRVYDTATPASIEFLVSCQRVADHNGRRAFFGFCRSGTQQRTIHETLAGTYVHLWRAPRAQFCSYGWPDNDYFMPGTIIQLLLSRRYGATARRLVPALQGAGPWLAALLPDRQYRMHYRIGRTIARRLDRDQCYALFYLSWRIAFASSLVSAAESFSLTQIANDPARRREIEAFCGIDLAGVTATPDDWVPNIAYDAIEARVDAILASDFPDDQWPVPSGCAVKSPAR